MSNHICKTLHAGISVKDIEQSTAWYETNLGFVRIKDEYAPPLHARVVFLRREDLDFEIELFQYDDPKEIPEDRLLPNTDLQTIGTKHIAFLTDNMEALKEEFVKNQVEIVHEVHMGKDAVMFIHDCNGVLIEFIEK